MAKPYALNVKTLGSTPSLPINKDNKKFLLEMKL